jgi:hypothetical protein
VISSVVDWRMRPSENDECLPSLRLNAGLALFISSDR